MCCDFIHGWLQVQFGAGSEGLALLIKEDNLRIWVMVVSRTWCCSDCTLVSYGLRVLFSRYFIVVLDDVIVHQM